MKSIYLAGPDVFFPNAIEIGEEKKKICLKYGFEGHFPLDKKIANFRPDADTAYRISLLNENLIETCDLVVANLTPFRGVSADVGTVYELGYAKGLGKRIHGYSCVSNKYRRRVIDQNYRLDEYTLDSEVSHIKVDRNGFTIESFDLYDNLMMEGGIHSVNGHFHVSEDDNLQAFEQVIQKISLGDTFRSVDECKRQTKSSLAEQISFRRRVIDALPDQKTKMDDEISELLNLYDTYDETLKEFVTD